MNYWECFALLTFGRGSDLASTWLGTPNLALEANPLARKIGWKRNCLLNLGYCFVFAQWESAAVVVSVASVMIASRTFWFAWIMRTMGEVRYAMWLASMIQMATAWVLVLAISGHTIMLGALGIGIAAASPPKSTAWFIGVGVVTDAIIFFSEWWYRLLWSRSARRMVKKGNR